MSPSFFLLTKFSGQWAFSLKSESHHSKSQNPVQGRTVSEKLRLRQSTASL